MATPLYTRQARPEGQASPMIPTSIATPKWLNAWAEADCARSCEKATMSRDNHLKLGRPGWRSPSRDLERHSKRARRGAKWMYRLGMKYVYRLGVVVMLVVAVSACGGSAQGEAARPIPEGHNATLPQE